MQRLYLTLAVLGAFLPYTFFFHFFGSEDNGLGAFIAQLFATAPADLLVSSLVFWIWSFREARARDMGGWWAYVAVNLLIGLSCAFPLFLFQRERRAAVG